MNLRTLKKENNRLREALETEKAFNRALVDKIDKVCSHEAACRKQNRELWERNDYLEKEINKLNLKS